MTIPLAVKRNFGKRHLFWEKTPFLGKDTYFLTQIVNDISPSCDLRENLFSKVIDSP